MCILLTRKLFMLTLILMYALFTLKFSQHKHKHKKIDKVPFVVLILMFTLKVWTSPYIPQSDPVRILILSWSCLVNVAVLCITCDFLFFILHPTIHFKTLPHPICQNELIPFQANYFFLYSAILESCHYVTLIPANLFWAVDIVTGS